nr:integrase, catalytic region, zinc finger, CCHC-type, peptidase aspartic, catalytic [Tanacetum cinerariifolium]
MANLLEDIRCAGSDTRPPMLDRTDFASWQQQIRLYCRGKDNKVNILKSINEGPYQTGTVREPLAEGTEGAPHLGPERPQVYFDMSLEEKDRYNTDIRATNILLQGLPKDIYNLINHYTDAKDIWDNVKMLLEGSELTKEDRESQLSGMNPQGGGAAGYEGVQNRVGNANPDQAGHVKCYNCNGAWYIARNYTQLKCPQNSKYYKDKMLLMQAQENEVTLDAKQLLFLAGGHDNAFDDDVNVQPIQDLALNMDNVFQADDYDAFDSDVDEAPMAQTMFMANMSSADPVTDEAGPSYDSDILSEYVKDNEVPVVHSNVSSVPNDVYMMLYNDMKKQVTFAKPSDTSNSNTHKPVVKVHTQKTNVPVPPSTGVKRCTNASGSQPRSNTKKNRISPANGVNKLPVEEQSRTNKSLLRTLNRVDSSSRIKHTVINSNSESIFQTCNKCLISLNHDMCVVEYLQSVVVTPSIHHNCCSKHMTGDRSRLMNFMKKFTGTVRFRNDHFGAIMCYGDYVIDDSASLGKHSCYVRDMDGVELIKGSRGSNLYTISR